MAEELARSPGRDPEKELRRLKRRFRAVSRRADRARRLRRSYRWARVWVPLGVGGAAVVYFGLATLSPWPPITTVRHLLAAPNCAAARAVGLAPARWGEPGHWQHHDQDGGGVVC